MSSSRGKRGDGEDASSLDPYEVLGLERDASLQQVRAAYRRLALKHHPDRQKSDEARTEATAKFSQISNAYEILSDEENRRQYDMGQPQQQQQAPSARDGDPMGAAGGGGGFPFHHHHFHHAHRHPFASSFGLRHHHPFEFHDPFQVFEQVFGQEFGNAHSDTNHHHHHHHHHHHSNRGQADIFGANPFGADPFMSHFFGGGGAAGRHNSRRNDPFGHSSFFGGGGGGGGFMDDPFFGGGGGAAGGGGGGSGDVFSSFQRQMDMMHQHHHQAGGFGGGGGGGGGGFMSSSSSSSTTQFVNSDGHRESVTTTTRTVNGKKQTTTERAIYKPDGTVERQVETSGDADFPQLAGNGGGRRPQKSLPAASSDAPPDRRSRPSGRSQSHRDVTVDLTQEGTPSPPSSMQSPDHKRRKFGLGGLNRRSSSERTKSTTSTAATARAKNGSGSGRRPDSEE